MAELVRMKKRSSTVLATNPGPRASRADYHRQYYLRKLIGNAESLSQSGRQYYVDNSERRNNHSRDYLRQYNPEEKRALSLAYFRAKADNYRQYNMLNKDKKSEQNKKKRQRDEGSSASRLQYNQSYNNQSKERTAHYHQEYYKRNDGSIAEKRRQYLLGKTELVRLYFGSQARKTLSWRAPDAVREYFDSVASSLNISTMEDWGRISRKQLGQHGGLFLYDKFGSLGAALQYAYPEVNWNLGEFGLRGKKSGQRWLRLKVAELLPGIEIIEDYQHPDLNWDGDSDRNMELDLWIPHHRVGIEYQGEQHYFNVDKLGPSSAAGAYSERDTLKGDLCQSHGITLITIPYWWDGSTASLSATLHQARPDVFPKCPGCPIPREMPVWSRGNSPVSGVMKSRE